MSERYSKCIVRVATGLIYVLLLSQSAQAQQAFDNRLAAAVADADTVALVLLHRVAYLSSRSLSGPGALAVDGYRYRGEVTRSWKGRAAGEAIEFDVKLAHCERTLKIETLYLVVLKRGDDARLQGSRCDDFIDGERLQRHADALDLRFSDKSQ